MAYCIFNLLLGTPPRLAEASLRTTADAATRRSSKSLILIETAGSGPLQSETAAQNLAANCSPLRRRAPPRSAREAGMRMRIRSQRLRPFWEGGLTCFST